MAKSKSQTKREAVQKAVQKPAAWKSNQQRSTGADKKDQSKARTPKLVKLKMKTSYRHFAKAGDVWETDAAKAKELVDLGRAEYHDGKKTDENSR